jgi:hypothetical protein
VETALVTQVWRALSEALRADHRGPGTLSAYQVMAAVGALHATGVALLLPAADLPRPSSVGGLATLWSPALILLLQALWLGLFLCTGRSVVTAATISFRVVKERI